MAKRTRWMTVLILLAGYAAWWITWGPRPTPPSPDAEHVFPQAEPIPARSFPGEPVAGTPASDGQAPPKEARMFTYRARDIVDPTASSVVRVDKQDEDKDVVRRPARPRPRIRQVRVSPAPVVPRPAPDARPIFRAPTRDPPPSEPLRLAFRDPPFVEVPHLQGAPLLALPWEQVARLLVHARITRTDVVVGAYVLRTRQPMTLRVHWLHRPTGNLGCLDVWEVDGEFKTRDAPPPTSAPRPTRAALQQVRPLVDLLEGLDLPAGMRIRSLAYNGRGARWELDRPAPDQEFHPVVRIRGEDGGPRWTVDAVTSRVLDHKPATR